MLKVSLLKTFVSVAESASFTRAASEMFRSQSAISMQIKQLEDLLQVNLFRRTGKAVTLSKEGEIFLQYCRRIIRLMDEAVSAVQGEASISRIVRVGCIEDYAGRLIPSILARFLASRPTAQIEVKIGETAQLILGLGRDHDIALTSHPLGESSGKLIRQDRLVWAQARGSQLHEQLPLAIALRSGATIDRRWATAALDGAGRPWRCTYLPSGIGTLQSAVEDGLAIGVFKSLTMPPTLELLSEEQGFPQLPAVAICLHIASEVESDPSVEALASAIGDGLTAL